VHTPYSVQLGKTIICPWPFVFRPRKPNAPIHLPSFHLPRLGHKYHPLALHRQQTSISYSTSFLPPSVKTLGLPVAMAGIKRSDEGPSDAPPAIRCRLGVRFSSLPPITIFWLGSNLQSLHNDDAPSSSNSYNSEGPSPGADEGTVEYIRQLLREKDEARENYSQETIRCQRLASELEAAQANRAIIRAQLTAADSRVACESFLPKHCLFLSRIFISNSLLQSWSHRSKPSTPQQPPPPGR